MSNLFLIPSDPRLRRIAPEVSQAELDTPGLEADIEKMFDVAYGQNTTRSQAILVGLAAPQIGINRRLILVDTQAEGHGVTGHLVVFINPILTWRSDETNEWYEGCFSTANVCGIVSRPTHIKITATSRDGDVIRGEYSGYTARIFMHEIDHLDGKEFVSQITNDENLHFVNSEDWASYRDNEGWRRWPKKCPRDRWHQIKGDL